MPVEDVRMDEYVHANLIADAGFPLLSETIQIDAELPLGSIIARDPVTGIGSLVTAATEANTFGVLRDHMFNAGTLNVVYVSGAFVKDTLKTDTSTSVDAVEPRLRELGIYCRPSTHYPSEPPPPVATRPWIGSLTPASAAVGSGPLTLTVTGGNFTATSVIVFNGADQATTFVDSATLTTSISPAAPAGERLVFVRDGSQTSNVVSFMVT
jgi:hypothetical protein